MEVKTKYEIGQTVYEIYEKGAKRLKCKTCEGTGKIIYHTNAKVEPKNIEKNCPKCDGFGLATLKKTCFRWRKSKVRDIYVVIESVTGDKAETPNKRIRYKVLPSYISYPEELLPSTEKEATALCKKFNKDEEERVCDALNREKAKVNWLRLFIIAFCIIMSILNFVLYFQGRFDSVYLALCLEFFIIVPCLIIWMEGGRDE